MMIAARPSSTIALTVFRRRGAARSIAAALAILALLTQFWVPLVHHPAQSADAIAPWWSAGLICHVETAAQPDGPTLPGHRSDKAPGDAGAVCPICFGLHICGTFVLPVFAAILSLLVAPVALRFRPLVIVPAVGRASFDGQPRAPPLMV